MSDWAKRAIDKVVGYVVRSTAKHSAEVCKDKSAVKNSEFCEVSTAHLSEIISQQNNIIISMSEIYKAITEIKSTQVNEYRAALTTMHVNSSSFRQELHAYLDYNQLGVIETVNKIKKDRLSFARYGDGEFRIMYHCQSGLRFQKSDPEMSKELIDILSMSDGDPNKILIGIPDRMRGDMFWTYTWAEFWPDIKIALKKDAKYGNAHVSRPEAFRMYGDSLVEAWRQIWDEEHVCIITGKGSRFELSPGLFSNLNSHSFIYSLPEHAYADLDRVTSELVKTVPKSRLCLVSLGPSGTVLVNRLTRLGYWCIDVGHISASYSQVYENGPRPESMPIRR